MAAAIVAGLAVPAGRLGSPPSFRPAAVRSYVVRAGDTVWSIAARIVGRERDPRPLVDAIVRSNRLDPGTLKPGQTLVVPLGA